MDKLFYISLLPFWLFALCYDWYSGLAYLIVIFSVWGLGAFLYFLILFLYRKIKKDFK